MKKYYVEVQNFNQDYRNDSIIYVNLDEAIKNYEKQLHDLSNYNYFANKDLTVCIGELIFNNQEDFEEETNYEMNELSCCDISEYYMMNFEEKEDLINRLKKN